MCQPYNQGWVHLLALLPSLCLCFPAALVQFSPLLLQDMEMLGMLPRSRGGVDEAVPPTLASPTALLFMGSMNYSYPGTRGRVCGRLCDAKGAEHRELFCVNT